MKKRIISLFLCLVMLVGTLPLGRLTVFAEGEEEFEEIARPTVDQSAQTVTLTDGTVLNYDEMITVTFSQPYEAYGSTEEMYAECLKTLSALPATLDTDKVYYVKLDADCKFQLFDASQREILFEGVNVILDLNGHRIEDKIPGAATSMIDVENCGLFALISSRGSDRTGNLLMENYLTDGQLLNVKNSNLIIDGSLRIEYRGSTDAYTHNHCIRAENSNVKILNGTFISYSDLYAVSCPNITIHGGYFSATRNIDIADANIRLEGTSIDNLHIYGGTFERATYYSPIVGEACYSEADTLYPYRLPDGLQAFHYEEDGEAVGEWTDTLSVIKKKLITRITTMEAEETAGRWSWQRKTLYILKPEDFDELYTYLEEAPSDDYNDVQVIFYTDMELPANKHYGDGNPFIRFDGKKYDRIKFDLNGYDISFEGDIDVGPHTELTVTDSSAKDGRRAGNLKSGSYQIFSGTGSVYLDNIQVYSTKSNVNPALFTNYVSSLTNASVSRVTTHFNPFYGCEKINKDDIIWMPAYFTEVSGCTVTIDGVTYDLKDWAVSNKYATYNQKKDSLAFDYEKTKDLDISECAIVRHPTISADCTIGPDENGNRVIYADGFAPVLKANSVLPLSEVTWGYLPPNATGFPYAMNPGVGNVTGNNCALSYHPEGGKYHYFLIVDGDIVDDIYVNFTPLKGLRLLSEISPEGVFLEETRSTCAQLTANYAGTMLEGETMESLTFRILNSRISNLVFNKEVTLYNGYQVAFPFDFYVNSPNFVAADGGDYRIQVIGKTNTGRTIEGGIVTIHADVPATSVTFDYNYSDYYDGAYHVSDPDAGIGSLKLKFTPENANTLPGGLKIECDTLSDGGDVVAWDGEKLVLTGVPGTTTITAKSGYGTVSSEPITVVVPVTDVEVNGVVPPKFGSEMNTSYLYVPDDAPYTIKDAYWCCPGNSDYIRVEPGSTPMINREYRLCVDLALKPGYQVPSVYEEGTGEYAYGAVYGQGIDCTVNAMNSLGLGVLDASASGNTNGTPYNLEDDYISVTYKAGYVFNENAAEIDTVFVDFEAPRHGQTPTQWQKNVKLSYACQDKVELGAGIMAESSGIFEVSSEKVIGGLYYSINFGGYADEARTGCRFADKVTFVVNGESYEVSSQLDGKYAYTPSVRVLATGDPGFKPATKLSIQPINLTLDGSVDLGDYYTVETEGKVSLTVSSYYFNYDKATGMLSATDAFKSLAGTNPDYLNNLIRLEIGFDENSEGVCETRFRYSIPVRILSGTLPTARQYRVKLGDESGYAYSFNPLVGDTIYYLPTQIEGSLASESSFTSASPVYDPISALYSLKTPNTSTATRNIVTVTYASTEDVEVSTKLNASKDAAVITVSPDRHWTESRKAYPGWLYSIDGVNWQDSASFTGMPTGTTMKVYFKQGIFGKVYSAEVTTAGNPVTPAVNGSVSGTVTSYQSETESVTIQLIKEGASEAAYETVVSGNSAVYTIIGVANGTYTMKVMKKNHVTREYTVIVLDTAVTQDAKIHLSGDINGDGRVNTSDVGKANAHAKKTSLLTGYELACADVNGDGRVNTSDVGKLNAHAKKTSLLW